MKKYSFLVYHKEYDSFLETIRSLGVLHVIEKQVGDITSNTPLYQEMETYKKIRSTQKYLSRLLDNKEPLKSSTIEGEEVINQAQELKQQLESTQATIQTLQKEIEKMKVWGYFDFDLLNRLKENGYNLAFYICAARNYKKEWETEYQAFVINQLNNTTYFVTITNQPLQDEITADKFKLAEFNLNELEDKLQKKEEEVHQIEEALKELAQKGYNSLTDFATKKLNLIELDKVKLNSQKEAENSVFLLEGWVPEVQEQPLIEFLEKEGTYYETEQPDIHTKVPILLRNSKFSKLFEPITEMFSLPNYSELDPTPLLAPFFMLFFGLCLGDGGYGLIILLTCLLLKRKAKPEMKGLLNLGAFLGLSTIIVGILTGAFFGIALDSVKWEWLANVKSLFLTQKNYGEQLGGYNPMMILAVIIGIIQILFGMCVNAAKLTKQQGFKYALSTIAWIILIIVSIGIIGLPALGILLPAVTVTFFYLLLGISALVILFYNSPGKNIFVNFGAALWETYNMATGLLGDTLSYIRLFALGLTGSILGGVFNTLAFDLTASLSWAPRFLAVLAILLTGHVINFGLCMIGAFVHPLRLTFVEFYKNAGFEGGGKAFSPFKKKKISNI